MDVILPEESLSHRRIFWVSLILTGSFYFLICKPAPIFAPGAQFFCYLAEGFRDGHLYMSHEPDPRMAQLPNPYDPKYNTGIRTHDASYYNGHNYLYYGPSPIVTLYLPALYLGYKLPDWVAALIFAVAGYAAWASLLRMLVRAHFPGTHGVLLGLGYACIALGSYVTLQLSYPRMYEVAVLSAQCFMAWAMVFAWQASMSEKWRKLRLLGASLMFGLALSSRLNLVVLCPVLLWLLWRAIHNEPKKIHAIVAAFLPAMFCAVGILLYNYFRFGAFLNDGAWYVTSSVYNPGIPYQSTGNMLPGLGAYFLGMWYDKSPYFFWKGVPAEWYLNSSYKEYSGMIGMLVGAPIILLIAPGLERWTTSDNRGAKYSITALTLCGLISLAFVLYYLPFAIIRYQVYFAIFFVLAGVLAGFHWIEKHPRPKLATAIFIGLAGYGCALMFTATIHGYYP